MDSKVAQVITRRPGDAVLATRYLYDAGGNRVARLSAPMPGTVLTSPDTLELTLREGQGKELVRLYQTSQPRPVFADGTISGSSLIGTMGAGPLDYPDTARRRSGRPCLSRVCTP